jgi:hypothetical protein
VEAVTKKYLQAVELRASVWRPLEMLEEKSLVTQVNGKIFNIMTYSIFMTGIESNDQEGEEVIGKKTGSNTRINKLQKGDKEFRDADTASLSEDEE